LESVVLELLEDLVVRDGVLSIGTIITIASDVEEDLVEHVILEVDAVTDVDVAAGDGDIT
jgi:hypothetical protein